ncbi:MAG: acetolactate synthase isozyme 1 small subunit [Candidatus Margulisiibacteriota bacterium]|nr:MAG: acetolactate synthase isozyme 1 small subunit [Candidatus Margulisbacteria bacterium GWD2_39_127]OGI03103.1 MAG: acetolactate synthase isozyme 1 small subunit [Candidatus Margulisbacteria bacterium GWF2_38_17]OGI07683.1 MAG: acetolactate synthase isozyme 1 small subunit [Candidatus Margulisbacteria bacterium GWE2_39_32]PZM79635.1 MAG: acetolactate synthase isozyme 1 small subunit [Candidatus Margulisiibacteriota bacterium]HAR61897.1 acetolactate synthase isozyme 1 small subunit [Candida
MTANIIIELTVQNHAGVLSHITGLFSRRAFNLEGILCGPVGDGTTSKLYLLVNKDARLDQIVNHLKKLYDVIEVLLREDSDNTLLNQLFKLLTSEK